MNPRAGLDGCGKSRLTGIRSPDRPACSDSLYQRSYPGLEHLKTRNVLCSLPVRTVAGWLSQSSAHDVSHLFGAFRILIPVPVYF